MSNSVTSVKRKETVVAIIATGGYAPDLAAYHRAESVLTSQGCTVRHYDDFNQRYLRFAASDVMRASSIHEAARDPNVDVVMALRGGYGTSRLLNELDFPMLVASGKHFVGHSDLTALHMGLLAHGGYAFAGPMICNDFSREDVSEFTMTHFWDCLGGPEHSLAFSAGEGCPPVVTQGKLWGGNLTMLVNLLSTPWFPQIDEGILFLEDINEHPFRVERMLLQLVHSGILDRQKGVLLGDFSGARLSEYDNGYDFDAMLAFIRSRTITPIITGLPFGHIRDKTTLAVGSGATLTHAIDTGIVHLTMRDYPVLVHSV
jgi:muramoyltetrapeptide carboxypeptidase